MYTGTYPSWAPERACLRRGGRGIVQVRARRGVPSVLDGFDALKTAESSCRISSSSRLWWELEEPTGPQGGECARGLRIAVCFALWMVGWKWVGVTDWVGSGGLGGGRAFTLGVGIMHAQRSVCPPGYRACSIRMSYILRRGGGAPKNSDDKRTFEALLQARPQACVCSCFRSYWKPSS